MTRPSISHLSSALAPLCLALAVASGCGSDDDAKTTTGTGAAGSTATSGAGGSSGASTGSAGAAGTATGAGGTSGSGGATGGTAGSGPAGSGGSGGAGGTTGGTAGSGGAGGATSDAGTDGARNDAAGGTGGDAGDGSTTTDGSADASPAETEIATGTLQKVTDDEPATGKVSIVRLADGKHVFRTGDTFHTVPGPDVHVYLTKEAAPTDRAAVERGFLDLGKVAANDGVRDYAIPANTDLTLYKGATIYCVKFYVVFGSGALANR